MTPVQIILRKGGWILVEWTNTEGKLRRAWATPQMVRESGPTPLADRPERGMPYGVDFSRLVTLSATSENLDTALKRRGIWTLDELRTRQQDVLGALQDTYGIDLAGLLNAAKLYEQELKNHG